MTELYSYLEKKIIHSPTNIIYNHVRKVEYMALLRHMVPLKRLQASVVGNNRCKGKECA